jgi:hypothetical protein
MSKHFGIIPFSGHVLIYHDCKVSSVSTRHDVSLFRGLKKNGFQMWRLTDSMLNKDSLPADNGRSQRTGQG